MRGKRSAEPSPQWRRGLENSGDMRGKRSAEPSPQWRRGLENFAGNMGGKRSAEPQPQWLPGSGGGWPHLRPGMPH